MLLLEDSTKMRFFFDSRSELCSQMKNYFSVILQSSKFESDINLGHNLMNDFIYTYFKEKVSVKYNF